MGIKENIAAVRGRIAAYCERAGVDASAVELVAVSKTMDAERVAEAYAAGLRSFGENRVQEFLEKSEKLPEDIQWNLIGRLQTNKVKYIINKGIYLLHALDRVALAEELQKQCERRGACVDALVQLNLAKEDTKAGLYAEELDGFLETVARMDRIHIRGVMTIGPMGGDEGETRDVFARAKRIYDRMRAQMPDIDCLSMGMTGDFGWAILEGSNMVRVGAAIFGERVQKV
jgi:pyridoxal phosphate enzyme (YggS family)